ncbi:MAG: response regulator [Deltaproteobacteria bacterium]|nr:response regulator [Deltaproteobacteria bacterium]
MRDISERKRSEEEKEKLQIQLNQSQKIESVGRLAGGVAHDFNNMLGVILGHSELALEQADPASQLYAYLSEIHKAARRSADLTRQLLAFARRQTAIPRHLDLNDTVAGMLKMLQRLIGEDIDLTWMPGADLWPVKMDPAQIDQILANLCVNARDAISGVGKISIETQNSTIDKDYFADHAEAVPGDYVLLAVSDDGCGMDAETLNQIFEPFFTTKAVGEGTGLGLSTVYGIVKQNNGFINVYSEPGQGATFEIYLPRTEEMEKAEKEPVPKAVAKGSETVLMVEDEASILLLGKTVLERYGYTVLAAPTPAKAITLAETHDAPIHLLITDVVMPEMNGKDLKARIETLKPDIKVLFISGYTADVIMHRGILEGEVNFLQKPFSVHSLAGKVREVLDREKENGQTSI